MSVTCEHVLCLLPVNMYYSVFVFVNTRISRRRILEHKSNTNQQMHKIIDVYKMFYACLTVHLSQFTV
jgi:hypothetical protein